MLVSSAGDATSVSALTAQHIPYLPPVDTVDAVWRLSNGASGTFSTSFAAPVGGHEYRVVCERGTVTTGFGSVPMSPAFVTVQRAGVDGEERKEFPESSFGVGPEVAAWGEKLEKGGFDERQVPEQALKDLEIVCSLLITLILTDRNSSRSADGSILVGGHAEEWRARGSPCDPAVLDRLSHYCCLKIQNELDLEFPQRLPVTDSEVYTCFGDVVIYIVHESFCLQPA